MQGQIIKIISNLYFVSSNNVTYECQARGKFRNDKITPMVGDYVKFDSNNNYILEILPRKNELIRPFVSNVDSALVVVSVKEPDFSTNLLDKLIVVMEYNNITPIICLTKIDLLEKKDKKEIKEVIKYYKKIGYKVLTNQRLWQIKRIFKNKTTVLTGQSGAGKSTLINKLDKNLNLETGEISKALGRGKHTTRFVQLLELYNGKVVDTPGFSMLDFSNISKEDIRDSFIEFKKYPCPYKDCMHISEGECNVKKAVKDKRISSSRYKNYKKLLIASR